ncbi:MAG TPA: response regulator transcription factor [Thermoanaerobaculia bacterium]|nr:response regulator transcription factor [Thermoanaerobaculia bacterium]
MRVLLIEDNAALAANVSDFLTHHGLTVDVAGDGLTGLHLAVTHPFEVVVLDLGLPGLDGLELCRTLRQQGQSAVPVLMLTARDTLQEKLDGFAAGADDYLVKPFAMSELEARIRALASRGKPPAAELRVGDLVFDTRRLTVHRAGRRIDLPPTSLKLLEALMRSAGQVMSRGDLEHAVWDDEPPTSDSLRTHIHTLRTAIDKPFERPLLHTHRGFGWILDDSDEWQDSSDESGDENGDGSTG